MLISSIQGQVILLDLIQKLKILMNRKNIKNISQLSRDTKVPYTTLKSIFDGDVNDIRLSTSRKLCEFFHITLDELLDDDIEIDDTNYININTKGLEKEDINKIYEYVEMLKLAKRSK